jgi:hypothetical protein
MPSYVVEGFTRGRLYAGPSLETALATLQREIYECRVEYHGPTDSRLRCDGALVETETGPGGDLRVAVKRARVEHPLPAVTRKHWQR